MKSSVLVVSAFLLASCSQPDVDTERYVELFEQCMKTSDRATVNECRGFANGVVGVEANQKEK